MKNYFCWLTLLIATLAAGVMTSSAADSRDQLFDGNWLFHLGDVKGGETPDVDEFNWRKIDLPHDWSIEDLSADTASDHVGPFAPAESQNLDKTGYVLGGVGWYRKHFTLQAAGKLVSLRFDGVYMNSQVWINDHLLGDHPYGYTSFEYDLTPYLKSGDNVVAVRVANDGKNSRWYSGSGIYRHTWLTITNPIHVPTWGVFVTTPGVSAETATVKISSSVTNASTANVDAIMQVRLVNAAGESVGSSQGNLLVTGTQTASSEQIIEVSHPKLWSQDTPNLYTAEVDVIVGGKSVDQYSTPFGIRKIEVDAEHGLRVNGQSVKMLGGCFHQDDGPLGSAAIDRAEVRKMELLKSAGYNAIRCSHNPPSPALLDACDKLGILVIDEAFDQWNEKKLDDVDDYHLYFKDWYDRDIASMVDRDRNHPSVIMWSIGNEIPERFTAPDTAKKLRDAVLSHDTTRPITEAVCALWGKKADTWAQVSDNAFQALNVAGYNYLRKSYEPDHVRHPDRVIMGTETYPKDLFDDWTAMQTHPYVIGNFVWTAIDYLGESGLGHTWLSNQKNTFFEHWPWYDANCGDFDLCGFIKPQGLYRDVVWGRSPIEMVVHSPIPDGLTEKVSDWGWPDVSQSWNWAAQEGKPLQVWIYSRCDTVRLELNGKVIGEKPVTAESKLMTEFDVPYVAGELRAIGLKNGKPFAINTLTTTGPARHLKLIADRTLIQADRSDLAYITVEAVDDKGRRVPDAEIPVNFSVSGAGELAAVGSGVPNDPQSYRGPVRKTFQGRCLAILRPVGAAGIVTLKADASGLQSASLAVQTK